MLQTSPPLVSGQIKETTELMAPSTLSPCIQSTMHLLDSFRRIVVIQLWSKSADGFTIDWLSQASTSSSPSTEDTEPTGETSTQDVYRVLACTWGRHALHYEKQVEEAREKSLPYGAMQATATTLRACAKQLELLRKV